jgi:hypothetical protein
MFGRFFGVIRKMWARTCREGATAYLHWTSSLDDSDENGDHREHKQDMNESP